MSNHVSSWAWRQDVGDAGTKLVLAKLADQANDEGVCFPSRRTLLEECEAGSPDTIKQRIRKLRDLGLIIVVPWFTTGGRQTSSMYVLPVNGVPTAEDLAQILASADRQGYAGNVIPLPRRGDSSHPSPGEPSHPSGGGSDHPSIEEPSLEAAAVEPTSRPEVSFVARPAARERVEHVPAAASVSEPVSLERAVASLATLNGWDTGSLNVVAPLLLQVPGKLFEETLTTTVARRARNPVGLFVHLLSTAIDTWRRDQRQAQLDTWDAVFGEAGMERVKREDPERYVRAWAAPSLDGVRPLPAHAVVSHVLDYVFEYVDDVTERLRLLELFVVAAEQQPAFKTIRDWILMAIDRRRYSYDEVAAAVETLVSDEELRAQLLRFANEIQTNVDNDASNNEGSAAA